MFKVIVCGSRHFTDLSFIYEKLDYYLSNKKEVEIIDGGCPGPDHIAEMYAHDRELKNTIFYAKWNTYGKAAGPLRNTEMAQYGADACVAFWDGKSSGTKDMINKASSAGVPVRVVKI